MNESLSVVVMLGVALLMCTVLLYAKFRLPILLRYYSAASLLIAGLVMALGYEEHHSISREAWYTAFLIVLVNAFIVPEIIRKVARTSGAPMRSQGYVRPALSFFIAVVIVIASIGGTRGFGLGDTVGESMLFSTASTVVLLGLTMMILRRDLFSQIIGFLVLEHGVRVFGLFLLGDLPFGIEVGFQCILVITVTVLSLLLKRVQEVYGAYDSDVLRELTE